MYIITVDCAHSNKHKLRLLYVDICKFVMELFSKSFFKQYFCEALLELAGVSVYYVCMYVCNCVDTCQCFARVGLDPILVISVVAMGLQLMI